MTRDLDRAHEDILVDEKTVKPVKRFLTPFLTKKVPLVPDESERKTLPLYSSNILSRIFFVWLIPLFNRGYKRTLDFNDLWKLDDRLSIHTTYPKFQHHLNEIITKYRLKTGEKNKFPKFAILKALFLTFKYECGLAVGLSMLHYGAQVVSPILIKKLINVVEMRVLVPSSPINDGIGYAIGVTLLVAISALPQNHSLQNSKLVGSHARTILTKALLEKSLNADSKTKHDFGKGKIFTLMSSDLAKIDLGLSYLPGALSFPIPSVVAIVLLIINLGVAALSGIGVFFLTVSLFIFPGILFMKYKEKSSLHTDKRVSLMREIINAMKMIKFHAWEDSYEKKVIEERSKESSYIFKCEVLINIMFGAVFNLSLTSSMTAFLVLYAIRFNHGNVGSIFASLALYNIFTMAVSEFPMIIGQCTSGWVSLNRVREFLESSIENSDTTLSEKSSINYKSDSAINITNGEFEWEAFNDDDDNYKLKNINLNIQQGEFIVITGPTGSGKSSLLQAINGQGINKLQGSVSINGSSIFYEMPWIQSATVRDNITFGKHFDAILYRKVIEACALESDIALLQAGDLTEVGERGVTLSGGQKARISLARAIYADKDVYLLDDVLSAVDSKVGAHIVDHCFMDLIASKTKVLVTHQLSLIYKADRVVFLNHDGSIDVGTVNQLMNSNPKFVTLMQHSQVKSTKLKKSASKVITNSIDAEDYDNFANGESGSLYGLEEKAVNAIPLKIYNQFISAGGGRYPYLTITCLVLITSLTVFSTMFANVWLSFWIDQKFSKPGPFYIGIYIMLTFCSLIFVIFELIILGYISVNAGKNLNLQAVKRLLHTPMSFIDTTPSGRILNRFTKDTNSLDNEIGNQLKMFIHISATIIGILVLCVVYLPWFAIAIPLLFLIFFTVTNYYQASSREVKRLEALSRSLVYNNFNEVLNGIDTIKSFGSEHRFISKNDELVDRLNEAYLVTVSNQRWIGISLDLTGTGLVFIVVMLALTRQFNISAASTGLITTYVLELGNEISDALVSFSEVENEMNSVERVCHYANELDQEAAYKVVGLGHAPEWPQNGVVEFKNVSLRYREGLPLVLKSLNFKVGSNEKIGIVGRTGCGKSTIVNALFRIVEIAGGKIEIDGLDIKKLGLYDLRSKLSIIPQDPVLFEGSIRKNLDPFNERSDMELLDALRRSGLIADGELKNIQRNHKFHLESVVEDEGSNFSLGERQLLALARALVRRSRILIMDEATSSVDYETDALVQKTISQEFKDCTVLCISHRLKTILKHDRVLVLEKGELMEFDEPKALFNRNGCFREMCDSSDITFSDF